MISRMLFKNALLHFKKYSPVYNTTNLLRCIFFATLGLMATYALVNSIYGIENAALMYAFDVDEPREVVKVIGNLQTDTLWPYEFHYGYFLHTIVFWIAKLFINFFGHTPSIQMIAFLFRLVSIASFVIAIILTVKLVRHFTNNEKISYIAGLFMASAPDIFYWSQRVHPDTLQLALTILILFIVVKNHNMKSVILASIITGISFGTKYSGIFLLPFIAIPLILRLYSEKRKLHIWAFIGIFFISAIFFASSWLISNPYIIPSWQQFMGDFLFEKAHVAYGHGIKADTNSLLWLPHITSQFTIIGTALMSAGILYWIVFMMVNIKRSGRKFLAEANVRSIIFLLIYTFGAFSYLMLEVNLRTPRYLFHILPAILILGVTGIYKLIENYTKKNRHKVIITSLLMAVSIWVISLDMNALSAMDTDSKKATHPKVQAGNFLLDQRYATLTAILADNYTYIPESFRNAVKVAGIDENMLKNYSPQIIILNKDNTIRWSWKQEGTSFSENKLIQGTAPGSENYYQFQKKIFADPGWHIIYENDESVILETDKIVPLKLLVVWFDYENFYEDVTWTKGNGKIKNMNYAIKPTYKYFVLHTYGYYPHKNDLQRLGLKILINDTELDFVKLQGNSYYFKLNEGISKVNEVSIVSNTFIPKEAGINNDTRSLGIDVNSMAFIEELPDME